MAQRRDRRHGHQHRGRGPQAPDDERLWRRLHDACREAAERAMPVDDLWAALVLREQQPPDPAEVKRRQGRFQNDVDEAARRGHWLLREGTLVRLRSVDEVASITASVGRFQAAMSAEGAPDTLLLEAAEATLFGRPRREWPEAWTLLDGHALTSWGAFDLDEALEAWAKRSSGLRFREKEPHIALLLHRHGRVDLRGLLVERGRARARQGENPFPESWRDALVDASATLPEVDGDAEVAKGRSDLRHLPFMTIDPADAKDFDDAVCFDATTSTLWIAIADVASYVPLGSALDRAARARATSVYLPHTVLPMLPPRLADDLCSLRANVDRRAMVLELPYTNGRLGAPTAHEAIVRVRHNKAYDDVLDDEDLRPLFDLAASLREGEVRLNLHNAELRPRVQGDGSLTVEVKHPNAATEMIEAFMVAANAAVGDMLGAAGAPLPWRCHLPPDRAEVEALNARLAALEVDIELPMPSHRTTGQSTTEELSNLLSAWADTASVHLSSEADEDEHRSEVIDPEARRDMLDALRNAQAAASRLRGSTRRVVDQSLFQIMQRATYSSTNTGHFGLDLDAYAHFTSPIRRYPDLVAHRQLKALMRGEGWAHDAADVEDLAEHCSQQGWAAKRLEWEAVDQAFAMHLLNNNPSGHWPARVVALRSPFVFLDLEDDGALQGRLHLSALGGRERLHVDEHGLEVTGEDGATPRLRLGERLPCRLRGVDLWTGRLDLAPV